MKYASRKYIDLIREVSSKWASWDPPHLIRVGDYGTVDKDTGRFEKDGNIYDDPAIATLSLDHQPEILAPDEEMVFSSQTEHNHEFSLSPEIKIPGIAEASIKGQWKFKTGKRGALLVMAKPRSCKFSSENVLLKRLVDRPELKDKYLVTETVSCHAYSLYLSNKSDDTVSLALVASTPIPVAPLLSAGGDVGGSWWSKTGSGVFRHGCAPQGTYSFTPLFVLKQIRKKTVFSRGPVEEEDEWKNVDTPWWPLDEDGEEEVFEDTVFE
ncbi:hypothetical protein B0H16DRAFT_1534018 [Mycena metata]|uniref:Uncharacterized protein n=1 Tax=Mycena metata TaxID=1033252 RepID=A0AAD7J956_9AGAR|nr:hypothetical protein B0H16DRAFT_1534018 [Mycena metata]